VVTADHELHKRAMARCIAAEPHVDADEELPCSGCLLAEVERLRAVLERSRFVADYWRRGILDFKSGTGWEAHPLCMVLAALDGETDPTLMGVDPISWEAR